MFFKHADGRRTTVPNHKGYDLAPGLVRKILQDIRMSAEDFKKLL